VFCCCGYGNFKKKSMHAQDTVLSVADIEGASADVWQVYDERAFIDHIEARCQRDEQVHAHLHTHTRPHAHIQTNHTQTHWQTSTSINTHSHARTHTRTAACRGARVSRHCCRCRCRVHSRLLKIISLFCKRAL